MDNYAGKPPTAACASYLCSAKRKAAGYQAFAEAMPTYGAKNGGSGVGIKGNKIYRKLSFGRTSTCSMDSASTATTPCDDAVAAPCGDWTMNRDFSARRRCPGSRERGSKATWKILPTR